MIVLVFSSAIEIVQFAANLGWREIDDVICNTLGAVLDWRLAFMDRGQKEEENGKC